MNEMWLAISVVTLVAWLVNFARRREVKPELVPVETLERRRTRRLH